jgi:hypothetical protein
MILLEGSREREGFVRVREWRAVATRCVGSLMKCRAGRGQRRNCWRCGGVTYWTFWKWRLVVDGNLVRTTIRIGMVWNINGNKKMTLDTG